MPRGAGPPGSSACTHGDHTEKGRYSRFVLKARKISTINSSVRQGMLVAIRAGAADEGDGVWDATRAVTGTVQGEARFCCHWNKGNRGGYPDVTLQVLWRQRARSSCPKHLCCEGCWRQHCRDICSPGAKARAPGPLWVLHEARCLGPALPTLNTKPQRQSRTPPS